jgi:BirA family biotin operon repressor/biotin-[acetyl-CoA-carboxylase] ligase
VSGPDPFDSETVVRALAGVAFVSQIHYYQALGSTNDEGATLAKMGSPEGTLVLADEQVSGRGRLGRAWHSPPGLGIWTSVLLRPAIPVEGAFSVTAVASLAVAAAVREASGLDPALKWPNDVLLDGKKVAGILAELGAPRGRIDWAVVGIGVNVHHRGEDFPPELRPRATSVFLASGRSAPRAKILRTLAEGIGSRMETLRSRGPDEILEEWSRLCCLWGRRVRVEGGGMLVEGVARELDPNGALVLRTDNGTVKSVVAGDVSLALRE